MFLKKNVPTLYTALGVYLPLITTNCAVLGVALLNVQNNYNFIQSVVYGITGGLGFLLAIFLFAAVREQLEFADNPKCFDGFPIALVTAGLIALAFTNSVQSHRRQPTRLLCRWDSPGKNTGVGCHFLLQYMHACMLSHFSCVRLCATPLTAARSHHPKAVIVIEW